MVRDLETAQQERREYETLIKRWKQPWSLCGIFVGIFLLPDLTLWSLAQRRQRITETRQCLQRLERRIASLETQLLVVTFQVELAQLPDETFLQERFALRSCDSRKPSLPPPSSYRPDGTPVWSFEPDDPDPGQAEACPDHHPITREISLREGASLS
jgi:hypothetical protein